MAERAAAAVGILLCLNLLFVTMVSASKCPKDALQFKVCANVAGLIQIPPNEKCCSLIAGIADADVSACLCTAVKANVLGIKLSLPLELSLLLNQCNKKVAQEFKCY